MKNLFYLLLFLPFYTFAQSAERVSIQISVADYSHQPIANDKIIFVSRKFKKTYSAITDANGKTKLNLPAGDVYDIKIDALGDELEYNTLEIPANKPGYSFGEMQLIIEYNLPEVITLSGLNFDTGKASIKPESIPQLTQLAEYLLRKKDMKIAIGGHTDNVGNSENNLTLSQQRADAVKTFLTSKGISIKRMKATGFGANRPIASNDSEQGRAENRRTELRIIQK